MGDARCSLVIVTTSTGSLIRCRADPGSARDRHPRSAPHVRSKAVIGEQVFVLCRAYARVAARMVRRRRNALVSVCVEVGHVVGSPSDGSALARPDRDVEVGTVGVAVATATEDSARGVCAGRRRMRDILRGHVRCSVLESGVGLTRHAGVPMVDGPVPRFAQCVPVTVTTGVRSRGVHAHRRPRIGTRRTVDAIVAGRTGGGRVVRYRRRCAPDQSQSDQHQRRSDVDHVHVIAEDCEACNSKGSRDDPRKRGSADWPPNRGRRPQGPPTTHPNEFPGAPVSWNPMEVGIAPVVASNPNTTPFVRSSGAPNRPAASCA